MLSLFCFLKSNLIVILVNVNDNYKNAFLDSDSLITLPESCLSFDLNYSLSSPQIDSIIFCREKESCGVITHKKTKQFNYLSPRRHLYLFLSHFFVNLIHSALSVCLSTKQHHYKLLLCSYVSAQIENLKTSKTFLFGNSFNSSLVRSCEPFCDVA